MEFETQEMPPEEFLRTVPNKRQQDKITAILISGDYDLLNESSVEVSDADRQKVEQRLKTGEINLEEIERLLKTIRAPFSWMEDRRKLFHDLFKDKDLSRMLTEFLLTHYHLQSRDDVDPEIIYREPFEELFLGEFPTPSKLEAYLQETEDRAQKEAETGSETARDKLQMIKQDKMKWVALQNLIYGKQQEYWDQIKLMRAEANK